MKYKYRIFYKHYFSLIELIVVISILLVMISLLSPTLNSLMDVANSSTCKNNLKQISIANHLYADDHNHHFIPIFGNMDGRLRNWTYHLSKLELYPANESSALCPVKPTYGMNMTSHGGSFRNTIDRPINRLLLQSPSHKIQGGDCTTVITYSFRANPEQSRGWINFGEDAFRSLAYRHGNETANVFYFDGHVDAFELSHYIQLRDQFYFSKDAIAN